MPTVTSESTRIIRDRQFSPEGGDCDAIVRALCHLQREHVTGTLMIDLSQGSLNSIRFSEQHRIEPQ
jgi:hypothetical protein